MSDKPRIWRQYLFYLAVYNGLLVLILFVAYLLGHPLPAATAIAGSNLVLGVLFLILHMRNLWRIWRAGQQHKKD